MRQKRLNKGACLLACAACAAVLGACGSAPQQKQVALAYVGRTAITRGTLSHWLEIRKDLGESSVTRKAVLSDLISLQRIEGEAREYGAEVSYGEARKRFELLSFEQDGGHLDLPGETAAFASLLTTVSHVRTNADMIWLIKVQMSSVRLKQRLLEVAEQRVPASQITAYFMHHRHFKAIPEKRDIEIFLTHELATAAQGKREILDGKSFAEVARLRNVSPEGGHDGLVMALALGAGEPPFEKHVFRAKLHVLLGPIKQVLFYVFRVARVIPERLRTFPEIRSAIRERVARDRELTPLLREVDQSWLARTRCSSSHALDQCAVTG